MIKERVDSVATLSGAACISQNSAKAALLEIRRRLAEGAAGCLFPASTLDASNADKSEILAWFHSLNLPDERVSAYWSYDNEGIEIRLEDFFRNYDELWFPGADDVWVVGSGGSYFLSLDHEEQFTLWK